MTREGKERLVKATPKKAKQKPIFPISEKIYKILSSISKSFWLEKDIDITNIVLLKDKFKNFINTLAIKDNEIKNKINYFVDKIFQSEDISEDMLYMILMMKDIFATKFVNENIDSFAHVLEFVFTSSRMPELYDIKNFLDNNFPGISQTEFMVLTALFHDLKKEYKLSQYLNPIDAIRWGHLSSHQWDGAEFLLDWVKNKNNEIYNYFEVFFIKKNLDVSKIEEFVEIMARIIAWHAGNTEFIQIDSARTLLNIVDYVDIEFADIRDFVVSKNKAILFIEDLAKENIVTFAEVDFLKNLKEKDQIIAYLKKLLVQKYIVRNIGRQVWLTEIDIDKMKEICLYISKYINKEDYLSKLLKDSRNAYMLDNIIEEKKQLWKQLDKGINKYLHTTFIDNRIENKLRLLFNINDIQSYVVPSSASFRKLLYHNTIDRLLTSPINGAVDVLAQLQLWIERSDSTMEKWFYQAMYYNGIRNLKKLINIYHKEMQKDLPETAPEEIKVMWKTREEAYIKACYREYKTPEELELIKTFFVSKVDDLCESLNTDIVYPSIKLKWHTLLCDWIWDLAYTETLDVFSKILVDESIDTIQLSPNMNIEQKRILYNMLANNYPLLEILRLTKNSQIINIRFAGLDVIAGELSENFVYNILDAIKNIFIWRFDFFYKNKKIKGRVVRNYYKNITFSMPWGEPLKILFLGEKKKKEIIELAIEKNLSYIEETAMRLWKTKKFIIDMILDNLKFGIWNSYLGDNMEESAKIDAFYKTDIMSRQNIDNNDIEIAVFKDGFIKELVLKSNLLEIELIEKYANEVYNIDATNHNIVVKKSGDVIINPILLKYIRKNYFGSNLLQDEKTKDIRKYIDLMDSCFEFISLLVKKESPFQEVSAINTDFAKWLIRTKTITQNHKWTYARQSLLELTSNKWGLRMIIDIDGMIVDNIELFKKFSRKILDKNLKKSEFLVIWHDITIKFVEAVDLIKKEYPEAIISIWWYEKYIYIPEIENIDSFIKFVFQSLDSKWLKAKLSCNYCHNVLDSKKSYDRLLNFNQLISYIEQYMEKIIYELELQDKVQMPNNISLFIWDKEYYIFEKLINKKWLEPIIKEIINRISLWEKEFTFEEKIKIWSFKLKISITYKNQNLSIKSVKV